VRTLPSRARTGSILPSVLLAMLLASLLLFSVQASSWRATRSTRLAWLGARAFHAADAAVLHATGQWDAEAFASQPVGTARTSVLPIADDVAATVTLVRTNALTAWVEASVQLAGDGAHVPVTRRVGQSVHVSTVALDVTAALTVLGDLTTPAPSLVSAMSDSAPNECGTGGHPIGWPGLRARALPDGHQLLVHDRVELLDAPAVADRMAQVDHAWPAFERIRTVRVSTGPIRIEPSRDGDRCRPGFGDPRAPTDAIAECRAAWGARREVGGVVRLDGPSAHQGLLVIDGDLELRGALDLRGLLVVRGALRGEGPLRVDGAVLIRDGDATGSVLPAASRIHLDRCAIAHALATIGGPAGHATGTWSERW
jgi:hypothetical protein